MIYACTELPADGAVCNIEAMPCWSATRIGQTPAPMSAVRSMQAYRFRVIHKVVAGCQSPVLAGLCGCQVWSGTPLARLPLRTSKDASEADKNLWRCWAHSSVMVGPCRYDITACRLVRRFFGHTDRITDMTISEDAAWLLSASMDGTLRVHDIPAAHVLQVRRFLISGCTFLCLFLLSMEQHSRPIAPHEQGGQRNCR